MELRSIYLVDLESREETRVEWSTIKCGDLFRIEPLDEKGAKTLRDSLGVLRASSDAYLNDKGVWTVNTLGESTMVRQIQKEEDARFFDYCKKAAE